jgi:hypothetical protein
VACFINILLLYMMPPELSISDATIESITQNLSIVILEASFYLIYDVYSTGCTYDDYQIICFSRGHRNPGPDAVKLLTPLIYLYS